MKKVKKIGLKILFSAIASFIAVGFLTVITSKAPEVVYGEELDWNSASTSSYTNIFKNGFYTNEVEIRLNSQSNRGAAYYIPVNATNLEEIPYVVPNKDVTHDTCLLVDGTMYKIDEPATVSKKGVHRVKVCKTVTVDGETFANVGTSVNSKILEDFYFYIDTSTNKIENFGRKEFYYSEFTSLKNLVKNLVWNFNGNYNESSLENSTIYGKKISTIEAYHYPDGFTKTKTTLARILESKWFSYEHDSPSQHLDDLSSYSNKLKVEFSISDSFGNTENGFKIMTVEDDESTGNFNFSLKAKGAFVFDVDGTDKITNKNNNTGFEYTSGTSQTIGDLLADWTDARFNYNHKYNILSCFNYSASGNKWIVDSSGTKIDSSDIRNFTFSIEGDTVLNTNLLIPPSAPDSGYYVGKVSVTARLNRNSRMSEANKRVSVPVFIVRRNSFTNSTLTLNIPNDLKFSQGLNTSYNSANYEIFSYVYSISEKYSEVPFVYSDGDSFRDYSSLPNCDSAMTKSSSLDATKPGLYNINFSFKDFYGKECIKNASVSIKDENAPMVIAKYDVTYVPKHQKKEFSKKMLEDYFRIIDDVHVENYSFEFSNENWVNSDIDETTISFHVVDASGNTCDCSFTIKFYGSNSQSWWEKNINPGLYKYKTWFLGIFGLNP